MAKISGNQGSVSVSSATGTWAASTSLIIAHVYAWDMSMNTPPGDVTGFSSLGDREFITGNRGTEGTIMMHASDASAIIAATNSTGTYPTVVLKHTSSRTFSFTAVLSVIGTGSDGKSGDPALVRFGFVASGPVTIA